MMRPDFDAPEARAYLDHDEWWESLTDEQRNKVAKRRQILGSLDDTYALNRSERGASTLLDALFAALTVAAFWSSHWIGYWSGALVVAVAFAWVATGVSTAPKAERPRPPMGGER
jgi:hypothetical protein